MRRMYHHLVAELPSAISRPNAAFMHFLEDWQTIIAAIEHWLAGGDPYGAYRNISGQLMHAGAFAYPPPTLLLGAPLVFLPWWLSGLLMLLVSVVGFEYWARRASGRIALPWLLLWLPFCQGLWIGQITLIILVSMVFAERAYHDQHDWRGGAFLALALIKPQHTFLAVGWLLFLALRERRWRFIGVFGGLSLALWGGIALISGPAIYTQWLDGLRAYGPNLPNRPLLFPPFGPILGLLAIWLWHKHGRGDVWGLLLLLNTLLFPLSVVYVATAVAFVVIRWRQSWVWHPLALSWVLPFFMHERTPDTIAALTQAIIATGLLAGILPGIIRRTREDRDLPSPLS